MGGDGLAKGETDGAMDFGFDAGACFGAEPPRAVDGFVGVAVGPEVGGLPSGFGCVVGD